jgi:DNA-binding transcriptional LysR family regulator
VPRPRDLISQINIGDLTTFLAVRRSGSVSGTARELGVTASQVSKAISRLEAVLRVRLFSRGARGVVLSDQARLVLPLVEQAVDSLRLLERLDAPKLTELTVAAPSYLICSFLRRLPAATRS